MIIEEKSVMGKEVEKKKSSAIGDNKTLSIESLAKMKLWVAANEKKFPFDVAHYDEQKQAFPFAKSNEPCTWTTKEEVESVITLGKYNYLQYTGFNIARINDTYVIAAIDIDSHKSDCNPFAAKIQEKFHKTYTERSLSRKGLHIYLLVNILYLFQRLFGTSDIEEGIKRYKDNYYQKNDKIDVECYIAEITNKYLVYTGDRVSEDSVICDMTDELIDFLDEYMKKPAGVTSSVKQNTEIINIPSTVMPKSSSTQVMIYPSEDVDMFIRNAISSDGLKGMNPDRVEVVFVKYGQAFFKSLLNKGSLFRLYYKLNPEFYNNDDSVGDIKLCIHIIYCLKAEFEKFGISEEEQNEIVDIFFRTSKLYRDKKWNRSDNYGLKTIQKAQKFFKENISLISDGVLVFCKGNGKRALSLVAAKEYIKETVNFFFVNNKDKEGYGICLYDSQKGIFRMVEPITLKQEIKAILEKTLEQYDRGLANSTAINKVFEELVLDKTKFIDSDVFGKANERYINFINGVLDISTGTLMPKSSEYFFSNQIEAYYNTDITETPEFDKYMNKLADGDTSIINFLLQFIGLVISNVPAYKYKKAVVLQGAGNTGKSVLGNLLVRLIGESNICSMNLYELEQPFAISNIHNKRLLYCPDNSFRFINDLNIFKQISSGDPLTINQKYKGYLTFRYNGAILICCNKLPRFGGDQGNHVYERLIIIPANNIVKPEARDPQLVEKLLAESSGIVYKAIQAFTETVKNGYKFTEPKICEEMVAEYKMDNNPYLQFIEEALEVTENTSDFTIRGEITKLMRKWFAENYPGMRYTVPIFEGVLKDHYSNVVIRKSGVFKIYGIKIKEEAQKVYCSDK